MILRPIRILIFGLLFFTWPAVAHDLPTWVTNQWWEYTSTINLDFNGQIEAEIDITLDRVFYNVVGTANRTLQHGSQSTYNVYIVEYTGLVYGEGQIHFDGPIPVTLDVILTDTLVTGEVLVETSTLNMMSRSLMFDSDFLADLGSQWEDIGDIFLDYTEEYDAPRNFYSFPLNAGNQWYDMHVIHWFGHYRLYEDLFSSPIEDDLDFYNSAAWFLDSQAVGEETVNGLDTVKVHYFQGGRVEDVWYSWEAGWNARSDLKGTSDSGVFFIKNWISDVVEFGLEHATPRPTRTPMPSTMTPTPAPPTEPPPTPTGTLPTPSPTYTLPPWFPQTPTPTIGPPTPTPPPPGDRISIRIQTNQLEYGAGDYFLLTTTITNPLDITFVTEYILLDIYFEFWFWPEWTQEINGEFRILDEETQYADQFILDFVWPTFQGELEAIRFLAFLTEPETFDIVGDYGSCTFDYR